MPHHNEPETTPLILAFHSHILAIDSDTGHKRWHQKLSRTPNRLFQIERTLFVLHDEELRCFDIETGAGRGTLALGFRVSAGIVSSGRLYLAGYRNAVCVTTRGTILWRVTVEGEQKVRLFGEDPPPQMICRDAQGRELWRLDSGGNYDRPGLLLGELVAQPDLTEDYQ